MIAKKITFTDYNGIKRTETHFFHLTEAELSEMLSTDGDYTFDKQLIRIMKQRNGKEIVSFFKDLIYRSYGEKSLDGRRFIKTEEVKRNFMETEAYSTLFMELCTDSKKGAEFINGILPANLSAELDKTMSDPESIPEDLRDILSENGE